MGSDRRRLPGGGGPRREGPEGDPPQARGSAVLRLSTSRAQGLGTPVGRGGAPLPAGRRRQQEGPRVGPWDGVGARGLRPPRESQCEEGAPGLCAVPRPLRTAPALPTWDRAAQTLTARPSSAGVAGAGACEDTALPGLPPPRAPSGTPRGAEWGGVGAAAGPPSQGGVLAGLSGGRTRALTSSQGDSATTRPSGQKPRRPSVGSGSPRAFEGGVRLTEGVGFHSEGRRENPG